MPFSLEQEKFIIEAYFRNGERDGNAEWKYSPTLCAEEWINRFPDMEIHEETLIRHIHRIVHRFRETGSVSKGKSSGRGTVLTEDVVADVRTRVERSPNKPLRQLAQQTVTYPLDLTKTRLQIQGELVHKADKNNPTPYRGMLKTAGGIVKEEGLSKLWQGMSAGLLRHVVYSGTRMVAFQFLRDDVFKKKPDEHFALWKSAVCGISAGAFAQYIASPTDLLKVQLQMEGKRKMMGLPPRVDGLSDAFKKVWKVSGLRGLWKGSIPNVQRAALVNLGDLTTYDYAKRFILMNTTLKDNHFVHVLSSFCAGFMAATMGTPADVIKTRVMNQPLDKNGRGLLYKSSIDCLIKTSQGEGLAALYKGFFPIWLRMAPWSLTFWLSYEEVMFTIRTNNL